MAFPVKFLSLQKTELEYEVAIRGTTPALTVQELRKQIAKLGPLFPSEDILLSHLSTSNDLVGVNEAFEKISSCLESQPDRSTLLRTQNLLNHLYHRLNRITCDEMTQPLYDDCVNRFKIHSATLESLNDISIDLLKLPSKVESTNIGNPFNITVHCDRGPTSEICKLKYDGKTCVRAFIQRVSEFREARNISSSTILSHATDIFIGDALHWYRSIKDQVSDWDKLMELLKQDFDQSDFDYRLLSEIRSRTQGEAENIVIYLSVMSGLFSRLSKTVTEEDKLEIILHNIRPAYANILASSPKIETIADLRSICRNYEDVQARIAYFHEPPKLTSETLAPELAYTGNKNKSEIKPYFYNNSNYNSNKNNYKSQTTQNIKFNDNNNRKTYQNYVHTVDVTNSKPRFCPRCREDTHNLRQCQANKHNIFCFVCGRNGFKTPHCPNCSHKQSSSKN